MSGIADTLTCKNKFAMRTIASEASFGRANSGSEASELAVRFSDRVTTCLLRVHCSEGPHDRFNFHISAQDKNGCDSSDKSFCADEAWDFRVIGRVVINKISDDTFIYSTTEHFHHGTQ